MLMDSLVAIIKCNMIYFLQNSYIQAMEKIRWREVKEGGRNDPRPLARWGHCSCLIEDDLIFFGGYADSIYMNDLWAFNTISMQWRQIQTIGQKPSPRSNCSLNYDSLTQKLIIFGGGGPNKIRYNSVWILNWITKQWTDILPKIDQPAPLERTYHSTELLSEYLVVFGGEGVGDLGDLWIFNTFTLKWNQVHIPKNAMKPCARRFHSSAIIGNEFFVMGGCYGKYRCLGDLYSLDLTPLIQGRGLAQLQWKERKMKNMAFLMRWGHTSAVFQGKIFVFGGRFCSDLGDVLVIDPSQEAIHLLKVFGEQPKPRRRHSAHFSGNSMIVFGGFNGQYFNDLYYLPLKSSKRKEIIGTSLDKNSIQSLKNMNGIQWQQISTFTGEKYYVCVGLLIQRLPNLYDFDEFLRQIDGKYHLLELQELIINLYKGYGSIDSDLISKFSLIADGTKQGLMQNKRRQIAIERQSITGPKKLKAEQAIIKLQEQAFRSYLHFKRSEQCYFDVVLSINNQAYFRTSKAIIALKSPYFAQCFSKNWLQEDGDIFLPFGNILAFQTVLNYLTTDLMVVPITVNKSFWIQVLEIADYLVLPELVKIVQHLLIQFISTSTCQELFRIGKQYRLGQLRKQCIEIIIKSLFAPYKDEKNEILIQSLKERVECSEPQLKTMFNKLRFSLLQDKMASKDQQETSSLKVKGKEPIFSQLEEKENCSQLKN